MFLLYLQIFFMYNTICFPVVFLDVVFRSISMLFTMDGHPSYVSASPCLVLFSDGIKKPICLYYV